MEQQVKILHNTRCTKSRLTLAILNEQLGEGNFEIVEYLKNPLKKEEILEITKLLGISPKELLRTNETEYKAFKKKNGDANDTQALELMETIPKLIQRPIVITSKGAKIGRPPENVLNIL